MSETTPSALSRLPLKSLFTDHPASVNETYFGHMRFALTFSAWLAIAAGAALIHAILPFLCQTTASRILKKLTAKMNARH